MRKLTRCVETIPLNELNFKFVELDITGVLLV